MQQTTDRNGRPLLRKQLDAPKQKGNMKIVGKRLTQKHTNHPAVLSPVGAPPQINQSELSETVDPQNVEPFQIAPQVEPDEEFDEVAYLSRYPDVAAAVKAGRYRSGLTHYEARGRAEGRSGTFNASESEIKKVLTGRDGWLFLQNDTNRVIDQITGKFVLPHDFASTWKDIFLQRKSLMDEVNARYVFAVAPNKECVYDNKLPSDLRISRDRPVYTVLAAASSAHVNTIYPLAEMKDMSKNRATYSAGDTHWNIHGGILFVDAIMSLLDLCKVDPDRIEFIAHETKGDLSGKLGLTTSGVFCKVRMPESTKIFDNKIVGNGGVVKFSHSNRMLPTCILFRDSFSNAILEVLAQQFSSFTVVWSSSIDSTLIRKARPDIVLSEQVERFLVKYPSA